MMPYQVYQLYQAERPKSAVEIRRADEQLGRAAESASRLWCRATQPIGILRALHRGRRPGRPARFTSAFRPLPARRAGVLSDQSAVACPGQR